MFDDDGVDPSNDNDSYFIWGIIANWFDISWFFCCCFVVLSNKLDADMFRSIVQAVADHILPKGKDLKHLRATTFSLFVNIIMFSFFSFIRSPLSRDLHVILILYIVLHIRRGTVGVWSTAIRL